MPELHFNWLAIFVSALVTFGVGFFWYSPKLFGNAWMKSLGFTEKDIEGGNMPLIFGSAFVLALLLAWFLSIAVSHSHGDEQFATFKHGAFHGALIGICVVLPTMMTSALFEQRSFKYIAINVGYWLVCLILMGGILSMWH